MNLLYEEEQRYLNSTDAQKLGNDVAQSGARENYENSEQNAANASLAEFAMGTTSNSSKAVEDNIQNYKNLSDQQETAANTAMQGFQNDHPLLADPAFDIRKLSKQSPEETQKFLLDYIKKQKESIANTKAKMQGDEDLSLSWIT